MNTRKSLIVAAVVATFAAGASAAYVGDDIYGGAQDFMRNALKSDEGVPHNLVALQADEGVPHNLVALQADEGVPHNLVTASA